MARLEKSHNFHLHSHVALVWPKIPLATFMTVSEICAMMLRTTMVISTCDANLYLCYSLSTRQGLQSWRGNTDYS